MTLLVSQKADFLVAEFQTDITIFNVAELQQKLAPMLKDLAEQDVEKLILDVAGITDVDSAGVQLLQWVIGHVIPPAAVIVAFGDNPAVQRMVDLYALDWPTQFDS
jgi:ABC-type transporter Mla MlaB component